MNTNSLGPPIGYEPASLERRAPTTSEVATFLIVVLSPFHIRSLAGTRSLANLSCRAFVVVESFPAHYRLSPLSGKRYLELVYVDKLTKHPYFTKSKAPKDSFPDQNSQKGKAVMGDNNEEIDLTDVVVAQSTVADQNELIMQLMQQIAEMRVEMQRRQNLPNPIFAFNPLGDGRPPLHFPPPSAEQVQNPPSNPAQNPPIIDLTSPNPHHTSVSYQTPPPPQGCALVPKEGQNKQKIDQAFPKLSHLYQSFSMQIGVGEGIKNLIKEGDIMLEEMIEAPVILDSEPKE
uniref:Integrase core domain containing protein n=1 Tax=Solanum tuberosum TaxID=4113 RepID=M1DMI1_SOLTU